MLRLRFSKMQHGCKSFVVLSRPEMSNSGSEVSKLTQTERLEEVHVYDVVAKCMPEEG